MCITLRCTKYDAFEYFYIYVDFLNRCNNYNWKFLVVLVLTVKLN